jgi:hypothetical protein
MELPRRGGGKVDRNAIAALSVIELPLLFTSIQQLKENKGVWCHCQTREPNMCYVTSKSEWGETLVGCAIA